MKACDDGLSLQQNDPAPYDFLLFGPRLIAIATCQPEGNRRQTADSRRQMAETRRQRA